MPCSPLLSHKKSPPLFLNTFPIDVPCPFIADTSTDAVLNNLVANDVIDSEDIPAIQSLVQSQPDLTVILIVPWAKDDSTMTLPFSVNLSLAEHLAVELTHHLSWLSKIREIINYKRIIVTGTVNSGKSSLTKLINNYLLNYGKVQILDLDCGQTEFTIPTVLALVDSTEPLYSGPYVKFGSSTPMKSVQISFGHASPKSDPINFEGVVNQLCKYIDPEAFVIANSNGWNTGFGKDVLIETLAMYNPDLLIELNDNGSPVINDAKETLGPLPFDTLLLPTLQHLDDKLTSLRRSIRNAMISEYFLGKRGMWLAAFDSPGIISTENAFKTLPTVTIDISKVPVYAVKVSRLLSTEEASRSLQLTIVTFERNGIVETPAICSTTNGNKATFVLPLSETATPSYDSIKILDLAVPDSIFVGKPSSTPFYYNYGSLTNLSSGSKPLGGRSNIQRK